MKVMYRIMMLTISTILLYSCNNSKPAPAGLDRYSFSNIFDISYTPTEGTRNYGWFTDAGSWMGFTIPQEDNWINGFCGPFSLDMNRRQWLSKSIVTVGYESNKNEIFKPKLSNYYPGEIQISSSSSLGEISQTLNFINAANAILTIKSTGDTPLTFTSSKWGEDAKVLVSKNTVTTHFKSGEVTQILFPHEIKLYQKDNNYYGITENNHDEIYLVISFFTSEKELPAGTLVSQQILKNHKDKLYENKQRWDNYITSVLRNDMKPEYDYIAVKAMATLISNWRTHRGGLLHEGIVPSHAVNYFVGFWAWDTWRFAVAAARFHPELAKNNIRAMFDYQQSDGMIIDCIYTDPAENNYRDSKPPLVSWAVNEIFEQTGDITFSSIL